MKKKVVVLGDGAWGIAIAWLLSHRSNLEVWIWSARPETAALLCKTRENTRVLPNFRIPETITLTADITQAARDAELLISAIPTVYLRATISRWQNHCPPGTSLLSLTKGVEIETFRRPSEILQELLNPGRIAALSGPSHSEEVIHGLPTSVVIAGPDPTFNQELQDLFACETFRVYTNTDLIGVELAGAQKNVIAIAAGICDGLGFGDNAKAALITRGLEEMARLGVALGAGIETYRGLAGIGDLITTCYSPHGRNRAVGERLGRGEKIEQILASWSKIVEGVTTAQSINQRAQQMGIEMPITHYVDAVLHKNKSPRDAVSELMTRRNRTER
ncbi:NAD(P)-dependent glycerol-3-phosphate dehydrogenase [Telmatocola sphagniphila]|uniref:Glycerol-3-phosphate dehydrogenase [NAD(P)+] n=1 Tax=Telmatocola sphagniphila TaxID=1123043 RepID=A0A8E6EZD1_9BACT|nr:NAD(P)H-dependent glycerol-3-phosphate dehydrogenase [Telmatocola sphagniphila]QVL33623.1 NAD(P)-dependent glycerol-3-phosphate dehydrogenase [Telmatocola sphagniphila]